MDPRPNHYETHLTLAVAETSLLETICDWAEASGMKWTYIRLDAGATPLQPMLTTWGTGSLESELRHAEILAREVEARGGSVVRVKIEASITNSDVPRTESEARRHPNNYFEHHVKVLLADASQLERLAVLATRNDARLSRNSRRERADGQFERFATQRVYRQPAGLARRRLDRFLEDLQSAALQVIEVEEEYVVFDSDIRVDAGWFDP